MRVLWTNCFLAAAPLFVLAGPANGQWADNLDSYSNGTLLEGQGGWEHWGNGGPIGRRGHERFLR